MKKIFALLLVLTTVFAALPAICVSAREENKKIEDLYVQDGLTLWLDGVKSRNNSHVDLANGKWYSRLDDGIYAEIRGGVKSKDNPMGWEAHAKGGIGWRQYAKDSTDVQQNGLYFSTDLIPEGSYTLEMVLTADGILSSNTERYVSKKAEFKWGIGLPDSNCIGTFRDYTFIAKGEGVDQFSRRWFYTGMAYHEHFAAFGGKPGNLITWEHTLPTFEINEPYSLVMEMNRDTENSVTMDVAYNGALKGHSTYVPEDFPVIGRLPGNKEGVDAEGTPKDEGRIKFQLAVGMPGTIYSVRMYNRALTVEERNHNLFVDMARYYHLDLTEYSRLSPEVRAYAEAALAEYGFASDKATVENALLEVAEEFEESEKEKEEAEKQKLENLEKWKNLPDYSKYYVQDGSLKIWLDGFIGYPELNPDLDLEAGKWHSKVGDVSADITGKNFWKVGKDGRGIGYRFTLDEYNNSLKGGICPAGIAFNPELLPQEPGSAYTVETVANIVGITDRNGLRHEEGKDSQYNWGVFTGAYSTFSFGIFKSMSFLCTSRAPGGTLMGHRWCYTPKEWNSHGGREPYRDDFSLAMNTDGKTPFTYTVTMNFKNGNETQAYEVSLRNRPVLQYSTYPLTDPEPEFHLFKGFPSTVYAIRMYDRVLTEEERAQNHMADLLNYYKLDPTLLDSVLPHITEKGNFYKQFLSLDFNLPDGEAQRAFDSAIAGTWMEELGISLRLDSLAGIRSVYKLHPEAVEILKSSGYQVEIGALLNVGGDTFPTLENSQYRVKFYTDSQGFNEAFSLGGDRYGFSVLFRNPMPEMYLTDLLYSGYLSLTYGGETTVIYVASPSEKLEPNLLSSYNYLAHQTDYLDNAFVQTVLDGAYHKAEIRIEEEGDDRNDGITAPVRSLERAYALLLELLQAEAPTDVTLKFGEGRFTQHGELVLSGKDIGTEHYRIHFRGQDWEETGETVLTGEKILDNRKFRQEELNGEDVYVYQFDRDENGNYPDFYYFLADGELQTVARDGYNRTYAAEEESGNLLGMWKNPSPFAGIDVNPETGKVDTVSEYKLYLPKEAVEKIQDGDFGDLEYHTAIAWYYRVLHVKSVDRNDRDGEGNVAVYFDAKELSRWAAQHGFQGNYFWFQNAKSFVDEASEYYYDREEGKLYYCPSYLADMESSVFSYPETEQMLSFHGVENVDFDRMVFTGTDNRIFRKDAYIGGQASMTDGPNGKDTLSCVYLSDSKNAKFTSCIFKNLGATAIQTGRTTENFAVISCQFFNIGSTAIAVGERSDLWKEGRHTNKNILVQDNYLDNIAMYTRGSVGIYMSVGVGAEFSYNTVKNTSYTALSVGWRWHEANWSLGDTYNLYGVEIFNNYFESFMTDQSDGGAIYTLGGNVNNGYTEYFNSVHHNFAYVTEKSWDGKGMVMPYYHDGASSNWHTYSNVEFVTPGRVMHTPIYLQNGIGQLVHNILVEENTVLGVYLTWEQYTAGTVLTGEERQDKIFGKRVDSARNLVARSNEIAGNFDELETERAVSVIESTGSQYCYPEAEIIIGELEEAFDLFYANYTKEDYPSIFVH